MVNFWSSIILLIIFMILSIFLIIFIQEEDYLMSGISVVLIAVLIILMFKNVSLIRKPIPKNEVIDKYIELMEDKYGISIFNNHILFKDEETPTEYVVVLKDVDEESGLIRYFPFECNKFDLIFGRGTGSIKYRITEVYNWVLQNTRINLRPELYIDLTERARAQTMRGLYPEQPTRFGITPTGEEYEERRE